MLERINNRSKVKITPPCINVFYGFHCEVESVGTEVSSGDFGISVVSKVAGKQENGLFCFAKHHIELLCPVVCRIALAAQDVKQNGVP